MNQILTIAILAVLGALVLGLGIVLLAGLFLARSLLRTQFVAYFTSPVADVRLLVFLAALARRQRRESPRASSPSTRPLKMGKTQR